ncbi:MAG TPA: cbb3-type cytochrome c oxidase subunit I [Verrucomicrobiae bacterium]|nr:cbb3-type cytochrome c oxidase subunit I [Verrucomicrobiae bacterium]
MNDLKIQDARPETPDAKLEASCRVALLALFGGAALWLVIGSVFALIASLNFHMPGKFGDCAWLTYGRMWPAANDALIYGFGVPAGLGVALWIFTQLGQAPLRDQIVPVTAANLWHLGVFIGLLEVLSGNSTGFDWLEFQRGSSVLLFFAYVMLATWGMANVAGRRDRALKPSHWFLLAALLWFPWIYSTANLFLVTSPVRGVAQQVIAWWFANNFTFVWTSLAGLGAAFYFLPKFAGRPLQSTYYALFAFFSLIWFGTFRGIPVGAPVPAWLPTLSLVNSILLILPFIAVAIVFGQTVWKPLGAPCKGGPFCMVKFGTVAFLLSVLMLFVTGCPEFARLTQFTWWNTAQTELQLYGFLAITLFGAIYAILPRAVALEFPFPKFIRLQHWCSVAGIVLVVAPLAIAGVLQGTKLGDANVGFPAVMNSTLMSLRVSTLGFALILLGNLLFALNIFAMTLVWKTSLLKQVPGFITAPLEGEVRS